MPFRDMERPTMRAEILREKASPCGETNNEFNECPLVDRSENDYIR